MLGGFSITMNGNHFEEQVKRSSKVLLLLQYLIVHRHHPVSQEELIGALWANESSDNPGSALRTMIYRARSMFTVFGHPCAEDIIISRGGRYVWNNDISCVVDVEEFGKLCQQAQVADNGEEQLKLLMQALELYTGDFLPGSGGLMWVMPLARYYRQMYTKCIYTALRLLMNGGRATDTELLCTKAMNIDLFDEEVLSHYLCALLAQGKADKALEEYQRLETLFYNELGVTFSDSLREVYETIQQQIGADGVSLEKMMEDWLDSADFSGAYFCDIGTFKTIYQVEMRSLSRTGKTVYILSFKTKRGQGEKGDKLMEELGNHIATSLRKGDVFTRVGTDQYVAMLKSLTYENCVALRNKILSELPAKIRTKDVKSAIRAITPVE